ncbi:hypothetical protein [Dyella telluris]|uniref:Uncharacterized protein n=1 Tax=Dyella telluris TaxID=2763498 RepID=A0A7G8Q4N9_9GAMM|nr:hypothetical protein [Dyella telluris]QNK01747.1 hypothetical protein H8F01_00775 [Dyella telluris]
MTYRYCEKCKGENGMASPTPEEIIRNAHVCPVCDHEHPVDEYAKQELLIDLLERVTRLEEREKERT